MTLVTPSNARGPVPVMMMFRFRRHASGGAGVSSRQRHAAAPNN